MGFRRFVALGILACVVIAAGSCSSNGGRSPNVAGSSLSNPLAPNASPLAPDSLPPGPPPPHPHPGPPPTTPALQFVSSDSGVPGDSATTRWQLFNRSPRPFTMPWTLTSGRNWPGFPKSGVVALARRETRLLEIQVLVPDSAAAGFNRLHMTVTTSNGATESADGDIPILASPDTGFARVRIGSR